MRHFSSVSNRSEIQVLDLGCGAGNNSYFFAREGFSVTGIDASPTAIEYVKKRFKNEGLTGDFRVMDMKNINQFPESHFNIILDRQSLSTSHYAFVKSSVKEIHRLLNGQGIFISFFYNKDHPGFNECKKMGSTEDDNTYYFNQTPSKFFSGSRRVTLLDHSSHKEIFSEYKILEFFNHKVEPILKDEALGIAEYITVARRA